MTLSASISRIQYHAELCTGVKYAPDTPAESPGALPAVFTYPVEGRVDTLNYDNINSFDVVSVDYITPRTLLNIAQENSIIFIGEFPKKLILDPTLNGACTTCAEGLSYTVLDAAWNAVDVRIVRFRVTVKIHGSAS